MGGQNPLMISVEQTLQKTELLIKCAVKPEVAVTSSNQPVLKAAKQNVLKLYFCTDIHLQ